MAQKHNSYEEKPMTRYGSVQGPSRRYRRLRHPTFSAAEWADKNPLLQRGEFGVEIDTHKVKCGNGYTLWNDLPYDVAGSVEWGNVSGDINNQTDLVNFVDDAVTAETDRAMQAESVLQDNIDAEALTRGNADIQLQNNINAEITARENADAELGTRISNEITVRQNADNALGLRIDGVTNDLSTETTNRINADSALQNQITTNKNTMDSHIGNTNNPHSVTKAQVGLGNVDNTSDLNKPISTATQNALNGKANISLDNLDATGVQKFTDLQTQITDNANAIDAHVGDVANPHSVTKAQVGLGNVDNTSDINKPISNATQTALDEKQATISDLATIRSNAQAGKSASDTIATYGDIVSYDAADFATAAQGAKADTALQAGDNVSELVNDAGYLVMGDLTNFVTKNTAQTISGLKTFSADITLSGTTSIKNTTNGISYTMLYRDASGIHVGTSTQALLLAGSNARPKFNNNDIAMLSDIPTAVSQLTNDTGFITSSALAPYALSADLATVATTGSYSDLSGTPTIGNATLTIQKNSVAVDTFTANATADKSINITVPVNAADVNALPNTTKYVANASMTIDNTTYVVTLQLKDQDGNNIGTAQTVDLPLESVVVSGAYDSVNKKIVLTLKDGSTIDIPVGDLVAGLQAEITSTNKLDADLVDDSTSTNKFVTASDKTTWNGKQDAISDLATIRSNASSGASAYTTIQGYGNIVTHNASEFATSAQGALADTAVQPGDLATVATTGDYDDLSNKPTIPTVGNGTITVTQGGVSKGTFTTNQSGNTTIALDAGGGNVAWGSIVGTLSDQTDLDVALAGKVDKGHEVIEFQEPTSANGYTWYRKYADGWCEQGGLSTVSTSKTTAEYSLVITLPIEMADTNYTGVAGANFSGGSAWNGPYKDATSTTTAVHFNGWVDGSSTINAKAWYVCGMAAS